MLLDALSSSLYIESVLCELHDCWVSYWHFRKNLIDKVFEKLGHNLCKNYYKNLKKIH